MCNFSFTDEQPIVDIALQVIKENIFAEIPVKVASSHQCSMTIQQWMAGYNMDGETRDDLIKINILDLEGMPEVKGNGISSDQFLKPLKVKKFNIGSPKNPKFTNIGDYWDDQMVSKITDLLHEF